MKKVMCFIAMTVFSASIVLCQGEDRRKERAFSVAASIGTGPVITYPVIMTISNRADRIGLEIGYQISDRIKVSGEFQYINWSLHMELSNTDTDEYIREKYSFNATPILLSLIFVTPINKTFTFFFSAGAGYHPSTLKVSYTESGNIDDLTKYHGHSIIPHVSFGLESALSKRLSLFGQVRQLIGNLGLARTEGNSTQSFRSKISGIELLAGVRIYI